jgi:hypothetical protein
MRDKPLSFLINTVDVHCQKPGVSRHIQRKVNESRLTKLVWFDMNLHNQ